MNRSSHIQGNEVSGPAAMMSASDTAPCSRRIFDNDHTNISLGGLAAVFGSGLYFFESPTTGEEFFAGYLLEQSLRVDNLLVFLLLFEYFKIPLSYQNRVLKWGISGGGRRRSTRARHGRPTEKIPELATELAPKLSTEAMAQEGGVHDRNKTYLDLFCESMKFLLTQETISDTDEGCRWDWRSLRCEPRCSCRFTPLFGGYHLGRSCRAIASDPCAGEVDEINAFYVLAWARLVGYRQKIRHSIHGRLKKFHESTCKRIALQSSEERHEVDRAWQEQLFCRKEIKLMSCNENVDL